MGLSLNGVGREAPVKIDLPGGGRTSAILQRPEGAAACYVFAHGAGAGMGHAFMQAVATGLAERGVATLRFNFQYMEAGKRSPDRPPAAHETIRAAVAAAATACAGLPLFAGGKSFGGRMTSQAQAFAPLPGVRGLVFFGFPLHPAGKPSVTRAAHLSGIDVPMLFLQGTRDNLAELSLLRPVVANLGRESNLLLIDDGDHAFHVRKSSGRTDDQALDEVLDATASWLRTHAA
jgi:predicted alpha/beta-hydrolase family hydrolase